MTDERERCPKVVDDVRCYRYAGHPYGCCPVLGEAMQVDHPTRVRGVRREATTLPLSPLRGSP